MNYKKQMFRPLGRSILLWALSFFICNLPLVSHGQTETAPANPARFFELIDDLPRMPDLEEVLDESMAFDKPAGRIVKITALSHKATPDKILQFYTKTLPQLGWENMGNGLFIRNREKLSLKIDSEAETMNNRADIPNKESIGTTIVQFMLEPL